MANGKQERGTSPGGITAPRLTRSAAATHTYYSGQVQNASTAFIVPFFDVSYSGNGPALTRCGASR